MTIQSNLGLGADHRRLDALSSALCGYSVRSARLSRDLDAVTNGLTLMWSSGTCEGAVDRIKALKRSMFGPADLDLLRHRIILPN